MTDEGQKAIEAAARAAGHAEGIEWDRLAPDTQEQLTVTAMAAIRAYLAALSGWRLVPVKPTEEMRAKPLPKPTIHELEKLLDEHPGPVTLMPDGQVTVESSNVLLYQVWLEAAPPPPGLED